MASQKILLRVRTALTASRDVNYRKQEGEAFETKKRAAKKCGLAAGRILPCCPEHPGPRILLPTEMKPNSETDHPTHGPSTLLGLLAILLWSSTFGFARSIAVSFGALRSGAMVFLTAGLLALLWALRKSRPPCKGSPLALAAPGKPRRQLAACGLLFVVYLVCLYLAIGLAANDSQVLLVGLINYLWPAATLALAVPIFGLRMRRFFPLGLLLALFGLALATGSRPPPGDSLSHPTAYWIMFLGMLSWSLYSDLNRAWSASWRGSPVGFFLTGGGLTLGILSLLLPEPFTWSWTAGIQCAYMALGPGWLAYSFWDTGTRRGNLLFLASASYLTPVLSSLVTSWMLHLTPSGAFWAGTMLLVAGAVVSRLGLIDS